MKNQEVQQLIEHCFTLLLVGDTSVGKTSLIIQYAHDIFEEANNHKKTLNCNSLTKNDALKDILIENNCVHLQIHDMSGPEKHIFIDKVIRKAQGILIIYDITNRQSFNSIQQWITKINSIANEDVVRILIGNKCDLDDNRAVTFEEGNLLSQQYGISFFETSAKLSINIENFLFLVTNLIIEKQQQNVIQNKIQTLKQNKQLKNIKTCI